MRKCNATYYICLLTYKHQIPIMMFPTMIHKTLNHKTPQRSFRPDILVIISNRKVCLTLYFLMQYKYCHVDQQIAIHYSSTNINVNELHLSSIIKPAVHIPFISAVCHRDHLRISFGEKWQNQHITSEQAKNQTNDKIGVDCSLIIWSLKETKLLRVLKYRLTKYLNLHTF